MKKVVVCTLVVLATMVQSVKAQKKEFKEEIKREVSFDSPGNSDNVLIVQNLNGSIAVEGYDGNQVQLLVEKSIWGKTSEKLEQGKQEIGIKVLRQGNEIVLHAQVPNMEYKDGRLSSIDHHKWVAPSYDHRLDFKVRVPRNIQLSVGTINNGEVRVSNMAGSYIKANNINGGIELGNVTGKTDVHAINGEVKISYAANPKESSTYYSLNGDINISYQDDLSAEIAFKSMNGELFTDFEIARQYAKTSKNESGKGKKAKYRYEAKPIVQIGDGTLFHDFETLNGNVFIKKI
ncbi:DUF4097 domain-containing protein [Flavobacteriaceae bacterium TP-CH-4]|uniref:DUF4097 domain-containing protein n=1 Tax=Pelagihabitans pacificus TaxID=2696054 RepID=A0A967E9F0_9FLAO|nr:DUF4097 family beta strand repeat-containing protein [Pelagihabitans pacificus]NHF58411.1 DUF4097 domain-containing protein [Pelagihabitans pacificus]